MSLSKLQQYILEECMDHGGRCDRHRIDAILSSKVSRAKQEYSAHIVTKSIERLIERGLVIGDAVKTKEKLYITKVRLTPLGTRSVREFRQSRQKKLPLKNPRAKR